MKEIDETLEFFRKLIKGKNIRRSSFILVTTTGITAEYNSYNDESLEKKK